jgi:hypothetical protein
MQLNRSQVPSFRPLNFVVIGICACFDDGRFSSPDAALRYLGIRTIYRPVVSWKALQDHGQLKHSSDRMIADPVFMAFLHRSLVKG